MTKARDLSKLLSTTNGKIAGSNLDVSFENISDTGTEGTKVASGTSAQRGSTTGQIRFNTTTGLAEYYTGTAFKSIDSPPVVTSISPTNPNGSGITVTITGSGFSDTGTTLVSCIGNDDSTVAGTSVNVTNTNTLTFVTGSLLGAKVPYDVKVTNPSGLASTLSDAITVLGTAPVFTTSANTNVGSIAEGASDYSGFTTMVATDANSDTITYSASGLPSGISMSSSNATLSGTAPAVSSNTNTTFTVTATDSKGNAVSRNYVMTILDISFISASGGTESNDGNYKVHTFNNSSNFVVSSVGAGSSESTKVQWLIVGGAGGGGGGKAGDGNHGSGAGGGAGGMRFNNTNDQTVTAQTYAITIGAGGSGGGGVSRGASGGSSNFGSLFTTSGGGGGGSAEIESGKNGGSGGGVKNDFSTDGSVGTGNLGGYTPSEGNNGGATIGTGDYYGSGGGGGHANVGVTGNTQAGAGGNGTASTITGSSVSYAGGGGGGAYQNGTGGAGGSGGGGAGGISPVSGTANLGGGGGGNNNPNSNNTAGGNGGKGVVIIRYRYQ